jgi:hypothetical protein
MLQIINPSFYGITRRYLAFRALYGCQLRRSHTILPMDSDDSYLIAYKVQSIPTMSKPIPVLLSKVIMVSNTFTLPSYFGTPFATDIPCSKYDSKGRQLSFVETEVQRLERMALVNAKLRRSSPKPRSIQPSFTVSPCSHLYIHGLTYSFKSSDVNPPPEILDPAEIFFLVPTSCESSPSSSTFQPVHKRRSLSSIAEED